MAGLGGRAVADPAPGDQALLLPPGLHGAGVLEPAVGVGVRPSVGEDGAPRVGLAQGLAVGGGGNVQRLDDVVLKRN